MATVTSDHRIPTLREERRAARAALRDDLSGAGPVLEERPPVRFPGATAKFQLFGEVMLVGLLVALVALPIVTIPAGLVAGIRHLRRFIAAEGSSMADFWADVRAALPGGLAVGGVSLVIAALLTFDITLAATGMLPGGAAIAAVGWTGLAALGGALLRAAASWTPERGWRGAVRDLPRVAAADPAGAIYFIVAAAFVGVVTWMLVPLLVLGLGCAVFAAVAVPHRRGRA